MTHGQDHASQAIEDRARAAYDACHPDDGFDDLKRRAAFSKEDRCLLRDWLAAVRRGEGGGPTAAAEGPRHPAVTAAGRRSAPGS